MWEFVCKNNPIQTVTTVQEFGCKRNRECSQQEDKKPWCSSLLSSSVSSLLFWSFPELLFCLFLCCFLCCIESWGTFSSEEENIFLFSGMHAHMCTSLRSGRGGWGEEEGKGKGGRERQRARGRERERRGGGRRKWCFKLFMSRLFKGFFSYHSLKTEHLLHTNCNMWDLRL